MSEFIIQIMGFAVQWAPPIPDDCYLKSFDHEAHGGIGEAELTTTRQKAMRFPSLEAANEFYRRQSAVKPLRADGEPNRPLTASHVMFVPIEPEPER